MKKTWKTLGAVSCAALLALTLAACGKDASQAEFIGLDAAKSIALENAGVTQADAQFSTTGLDRRDGTDFYAVDFTANGQSYEYDIDAITGAIITGPAAAAPGSAAPEASPSPSVGPEGVTADQAKEIALSHAGLTADQATFIRAQLDRDDGRQVYDVEFFTADGKEYDYEIDAATGEVLSYDYDAERQAAAASGTASITEAEAKALVLAQVPGAAEENFLEFKTDYDDGRLEYEGELFYDGMKYEFTVDGYSGTIREWESEKTVR